jgi:hypothetical protein
MTYVVAWLSPRSQTSTLISISLITLMQNAKFEIQKFTAPDLHLRYTALN